MGSLAMAGWRPDRLAGRADGATEVNCFVLGTAVQYGRAVLQAPIPIVDGRYGVFEARSPGRANNGSFYLP